MVVFFLYYLLFLSDAVNGFSGSVAEQIHLFGFDSDQPSLTTTSLNLPALGRRFARSLKTEDVFLSVSIDKENITFKLHSKHEIVQRIDVEDCMFQGHSISPNTSFSIALTGCGHESQGIILTDTDTFYVIRPANILNNSTLKVERNSDAKDADSHFIQKRSADWSEHTQCGYSLSDDPHPEDVLEQRRLHSSDFLPVQKYKDLKIELGLFVDDAMWNFFQKFYGNSVEKQLKRFVLTVVNNIDILFTHSSIEPKVHLRITHFEILKTPPMGLTRGHHSGGEVTKLLEGFCAYQAAINPSSDDDPIHWDHALLLTGYDLYRGTEKTIAGFAPVKGMCVDLKSCTVNEGLDFGAVFVIAHEMGHSLGMYHDGEANVCQSKCCLMSPSIGAGKTQWSDCSTNELRFFVSKLGTDDRAINCLADDETDMVPRFRKALPGQQYGANEQCSLFHGSCWTHELKFGQQLKDVCEMVWCANGKGIIRNTHPALEGTYCGPESICIEGSCVPASTYNISMHTTDGQWSEWTSTGNCVGGCNECQISGQIRVRSSIRLCNHPFKNNGGGDCLGSHVRGIMCTPTRCDNNQSTIEYADKSCAKHARDPINLDLELSGKGFQFGQNPCKIWCQLGQSRDIRTMEDFPDGTPCGAQRYCISGQCHNLSCTSATLVQEDGDCPSDSKIEDVVVDLDRERGPTLNQTLIDISFWTEWDPWTECQSPACGQNGTKQRQRNCLFKDSQLESQLCTGPKRQRTTCQKQCQ